MITQERDKGLNLRKNTLFPFIILIAFSLLFSMPLELAPANTAHSAGTPFLSEEVIVGNVSKWENQTIILNGNLTINATGELTMYNVTLVINSTFDGQYGIFVEGGGKLLVYDSNITVWDTNTTVAVVGSPIDPVVVSKGLKMKFDVYGNLTIERSRISYLWGEWLNDPWIRLNGGIRIFSNDVVIRDTYIGRGEIVGLTAWGVRNLRLSNVTFTLCNVSAAQIESSQVDFDRVTVYENGQGCFTILYFRKSNFTLTNSHIFSNRNMGIFSAYSLGSIIGNNFSDNKYDALVSLEGTLVVQGNVFRRSWRMYGIFLQRDNGSLVSDNYIEGNGADPFAFGTGIFLTAPNGTVLRRNTIVDNFRCGIMVLAPNRNMIYVEENNILDNPIGILVSSSGDNLHVINSTIDSTEYDIKVISDGSMGPSGITVLNTTFDKNKVFFMYSGSYLTVEWYMHVKVMNRSGFAVQKADVEIKDIQGQVVHNGTTHENGYLKWLVVREYIQNDTNGDNDGLDPGEKVMHTPHNVTASKDGVTGYTIPDPLMNESKTVTVVLDVELPPRPPELKSARLAGPALEDVLLSWNLSEDDRHGGSVDHYSIYYGTQYDHEGLGYRFLGQVPAGNASYLHQNAGEGDPNNYSYFVQANDSLDRGSWKGQAAKFTRFLENGPNLISIPLIQSNESIERVVQTVRYDKAWYYDSLSQEWKSYMSFKDYRRGLWSVDHTMGLWVNVTSECNLTVAGVVPASTSIHLVMGWNLVGFPSFDSTYSVLGLKMTVGSTRVEAFDSLPPYYLRVLGDSEVLQAGYGYWIRVASENTWVVEFS